MMKQRAALFTYAPHIEKLCSGMSRTIRHAAGTAIVSYKFGIIMTGINLNYLVVIYYAYPLSFTTEAVAGIT